MEAVCIDVAAPVCDLATMRVTCTVHSQEASPAPVDMKDSDLPAAPVELEDLPDSVISGFMEKLNLRGLLNFSLAVKRFTGLLKGNEHIWATRFAADFPLQTRPSTSPAADEYRRRHAIEAAWEGRRMPTSIPLHASESTVFGCAFAHNVAISGSVSDGESPTLAFFDARPQAPTCGQLLLTPKDALDLGGIFNVVTQPQALGGGHSLVASGFRGDAAVYDVPPPRLAETLSSAELKALLKERREPVIEGIAFEKSELLAKAGGRKSLVLNVSRRFTLTGHLGPIVCSRLRGDLVVTSSFDGSIKVWNIEACKDADPGKPRVLTSRASLTTEVEDDMDHHQRSVGCVHLHPAHENHVARGGNDCRVLLWDLPTQKVVQTFDGHEGWVWCLDGTEPNVYLSAGTDSTIRCWDVRQGSSAVMAKTLGTRGGASACGPIGGLALRPCGNQMFCGAFDHLVRVIDRRTLKTLAHLPGHDEKVSRVAIYRDQALSASFDSTCRLWDFAGSI